jgi:hypothetical protein
MCPEGQNERMEWTGRGGASEKYGWVLAPPVPQNGTLHESRVPITSAQPRRLRSEPNSRRGTRSDIRCVTDSYLEGTTDNTRLRLSALSPSLSDVDDEPTSESYSWLELELELKPDDDEVRRGTSAIRRGHGLVGERRREGGCAGRKLTARSFFFTGGWRKIVSVSRDKGTRHVGQRPSDPAAESQSDKC